MKRSLILALKNDDEFGVFKSLSVCLFYRGNPYNKFGNLVALKQYFQFVTLNYFEGFLVFN